MAIQVRRGLLKNFKPAKLVPGEWAVSIDAATDNQIVWMCFAPGVTKRMGTYEDFRKQMEETAAGILDEYRTQLNVILAEVQRLAQQTRDDKNMVSVIKTEIQTIYLPQMQRHRRTHLLQVHLNPKIFPRCPNRITMEGQGSGMAKTLTTLNFGVSSLKSSEMKPSRPE